MRVSTWRQQFVRHPLIPTIRYVMVVDQGRTRYGWCNVSGVVKFDFENEDVSLAEAMRLFHIKQLK